MSKKDSSWDNYKGYLKGKEKLKNAVLQHPEESEGGNSVYNYMKGQVRRDMWVMGFDQFKDVGLDKKSKKK
jgi:hypothetical protein